MENADKMFSLFIGTWIVLGVVSAAFFFLNNNAELKRKVWVPYLIVVDVLFIGFILLMGFPVEVLYILGPAIIIITILNMKMVKFCGSCGKTLMSQNFISPPKYCSKCGAELDNK
jgi:hypothetical protein